MSAIADVTDENERPRYLGYVYAITSLAYIAGPLAGGVMAEYIGYALPFWIVLVGLVAVLVWLQSAFAETQPASARRATPLLRSLTGLSRVVTDIRLRRNYLGNLVVFVAAMGFWRVITIYLVDEWGLSVGPVTACYAVLAVAGACANLVVMPRLVGRVPMSPLALVSLLAGAATMAAVVVPSALGWSGSLALAIILASVSTLFMSLALPAVAALLSAAAPVDQQGSVLGNNAALVVLGEVLGVTSGALLAGIDPAVPVLVLACLAALAPVVLGVRFARPAQAGSVTR